MKDKFHLSPEKNETSSVLKGRDVLTSWFNEARQRHTVSLEKEFQPNRPITALLACRYHMVNRLLTEHSKMLDDIAIVGSATDESTARALTLELRPDVVVLDERLAGRSSHEIAKEIRRQIATRFILLTGRCGDRVRRFSKNFHGVASMCEPPESLLGAIRAAARGDRFSVRAFGSGECRHCVEGVKPLTRSELQVAILIASGYPNKEVADLLGVSVRTVENQRRSVMQKTASGNTADLTRWAMREGLLTP